MSLMSAYQDLITSQHRGKPKYLAALTALLRHSNDIFGLGIYVDDDFDLDLSEGAQMDILGQIVGASRTLDWQPQTQATPVLGDDDYRILLKATIAKNLWIGGIEDLEAIWLSLFGERIKIIDNQDMTIDVIIDNVPSSVMQEMISRGMIVPKPQSVYMKYDFIRTEDATIYFGGFGSTWKKTTVSPAKPSDATDDASVYFGGIGSTWNKIVVGPKAPDGSDGTSTPYIAGIYSTHKRYTIEKEEE